MIKFYYNEDFVFYYFDWIYFLVDLISFLSEFGRFLMLDFNGRSCFGLFVLGGWNIFLFVLRIIVFLMIFGLVW